MRYLFFVSASLIFALGLLMIFSTTSAEVLDLELQQSTHQAIMKQLLYAGLGVLLAIFVRSVGYRIFFQASPVLLTIFTLLLVLVLIPGIGREVNGSRRWIALLGFYFQPSEFVKYLLPVYFLYRILPFQKKKFTIRDFFKILLPISIPILLILVEPNNGTVVGIVITIVMLCFLVGVPLKYWAVPIAAFAVVGSVFAYQLPYVSGRLKVYLHPELDIRGKGHQPHQAKIAAGTGKLYGKGPGNSWQKLSYLPEAQNDYIAAIYAEEFGYLGMLLLITLYMILAMTGFHLANQASTPEGFSVAVVVTFLLTFQAFLNLGVVSGLLPSTGLNLPLFSQGGSSLIANLIGIGLLDSVTKGSLKNNVYNHTGKIVP